MVNRNRLGPEGKGPRTGRGFGKCEVVSLTKKREIKDNSFDNNLNEINPKGYYRIGNKVKDEYEKRKGRFYKEKKDLFKI